MTADDWHAAWLSWDPKRDGTAYSDLCRLGYKAGWEDAQADRTATLDEAMTAARRLADQNAELLRRLGDN
ncbi:hypothetical protein [Clavibacter capsici]|uniref:hypothetical protein n=1 Tax=Clavibacter capsici TaxID=1874630 RepID=UPI0014286D14|nr:hypothetical protein [Clavibacter capsici]QIS38653.1 hypothetical protein GW572_04570 [Clavibacter capsici]